MQHHTIRGKILYLREGQETGREWFTVSQHLAGERTVRAHCEMDDHELLRDVIYSVDKNWKPLDCFVRLTIKEQFVGSAWFMFQDNKVEAEGFTSAEGRYSQSFPVAQKTPSFGAHPIVCDSWHLSQFDHDGPKQQTIKDVFLSSPAPDGGTGPMLSRNDLTIIYHGIDTITVPAGEFKAQHYAFVLEEPHPANEELWCIGENFIPIKISYPIYGSTYELSEIVGI